MDRWTDGWTEGGKDGEAKSKSLHFSSKRWGTINRENYSITITVTVKPNQIENTE